MKISIVLPCYNGEKYLETALKSIQVQTTQPHEILLIDDGSKDDSIKIAKEYGSQIYRNSRNMGIGYTRQRGLDLSTGTHVAFLSVDDAYSPKFIEISKKALGENMATYTDYYRCDHRLKPNMLFEAPNYTREEAIKWALCKNMFVNFSSIIIPKNISVKFIEELKHGEDLIFFLDTIINDLDWVRIPKPLVYYRIHQKQGTKKKDINEFCLLWKHIIRRLEMLGVDRNLILNKFEESKRKFIYFNNPFRMFIRKLNHQLPNHLKKLLH